MKDRNFVKEIEKLRTAVLGYDREEVVLYIRELVEYYGQKNEEAVRELYLEKMQLAAENAGLRAQIPTQEKLYAEAEGKAEEILGGAKETAATILDHAGTEKERMLKEAGEAEKRILAEADRKAGETLAEADRKAGETLTEAERKAGEILAEAGRQAEEILAEAGRQMDVILTKTREKVEKQQALYHQYRSRLEALKKGLDCIFAGCPPEEDTRDLHGKPQRPGQIQADGLEETWSPGTAMNGGEQYSLDMALLKVREEKRKRKMRSERAVILFVVWILVFRVCGIMRVDGNSMRPACHPGDIVFFLRILPDGVDYGDAVILKDASGEYLIKRIAGLPGDVMEVDREGHLTRNGAKVQETDVIFGLSETGDSVDYPYTVPEGSYFFLGDNRPVSLDSRMLGAAGREEIKGKVIWAAGAGRWNKKTGKR